MKRLLIVILSLGLLLGCSAKVVYGPGGLISASNYTIIESEMLDQNGKIISRTTSKTPFFADRWYSDWLDKIGPLVASLGSLMKMFYGSMPLSVSTPVAPVVQQPSVQAPAPVLTPYPAPGK